tara:strand:+ start:235 stop:369 length:135 start_codon:yes stop_codon:yes gene_type:complete
VEDHKTVPQEVLVEMLVVAAEVLVALEVILQAPQYQALVEVDWT